MDMVTIDFETYYDREYSLSKLTTEEYIRDRRFEIVGVGRAVNDQPAEWYSGDDTAGFIHAMDYSNKAVLCHNTVFDGAIMSWRFGVRPKLWLDTLSMARPAHAGTTGVSLKALVDFYGLGAKGDEVVRALGMRRADFTAEQMRAYEDYCLTDVDLTRKLFAKLGHGFPKQELITIDQTIRMFTEPKFVIDEAVLDGHMRGIYERRRKLLDKLGGEEKAKPFLMSNPKFAALLDRLGVSPPMKISPATGKKTYAFAKTDTEFLALKAHPKAAVRTLVEARLGTKSTLEETRTQRFLDIAARGPLPIMLHYYGAHTGRFSGGDKINLQNLPRSGILREALHAPEGKVVVACDSSQIEARLVAYIAGQDDLVESFRLGRDVYCEFASEIYHRNIAKADKLERYVGKTCILGLGYGMGAPKFKGTLATGAMRVDVDDNDAARIVSLYRSRYNRIPALWSRCDLLLRSLHRGESGSLGDPRELLEYDAEGVVLPNGMRVRYPALTVAGRGFKYIKDARTYRSMCSKQVHGEPLDGLPWVNIYGGKVVENIIQALARIVITEQMARIGRRFPVALQVHDEIVCLVDEDKAQACRDHMVEVMSEPPTWAPDLPVACEAGMGPNYGEAK